MFTEWGKRLICARVSNPTNQMFLPVLAITTSSVAFIEAKTISGITKYVSPYIYNSNNIITSALVASGGTASYGWAFGSGNSTPTENDYTLENQVTGFTATLQGGNAQTIFDSQRNKYISRMEFNITNNNSDDITIGEVGLFYRINPSNTMGGSPDTSNSNRHCFMIDRTVLDAPLVLSNGESGKVYYDFVL